MNNVSLKKGLILSLSVLAMSVNANTSGEKQALAKQCQDLAQTVATLVAKQEKNTCAEKLGGAAVLIEKAGFLILDHSNTNAKQSLDSAVSSLQYAELTICNRYIEILHSKSEANKIKNSI